MPAAPANDTTPDFGLTRYAFYAGVVICASLFVILGNRLRSLFEERPVRLYLVTALVMSLGTLLFGYSSLDDIVDPVMMGIVTCFLIGACYNVFLFALYVKLALTEDIKVAIGGVAVTLILKLFISKAVGLLAPPEASLLIGAALPVTVAALLVLTIKEGNDPPPAKVASLSRGRNATFMLPCCSSSAFAPSVSRPPTILGSSRGSGGSVMTLRRPSLPYLTTFWHRLLLRAFLSYSAVLPSCETPENALPSAIRYPSYFLRRVACCWP
jgi:hypothetical protein